MLHRFRPTTLVCLLLLSFVPLAYADKQQQPPSKPQPLTKQTQFQLIRSLDAELAYARKTLPMGEKGITLTPEGKITPGGDEMARLLATFGPAAHPGDRVRITDVIFKGNSVRFEINGGPKRKKKWYEHLQVGMNGTMTSPTAPDANINPRGSAVTLVFPNYVPEMTAQQVKNYLSPVLDFSSLSATEAYLDTIPPHAKQAIKEHRVLVGMNREMVNIALGRPSKKIRDRDERGRNYEEWIYGEPPQDVQFIRFIGDEVALVKIMKIGGEKIERTEKEVDVKTVEAKPQEAARKPTKRPSLRRPGEEPESTPTAIGLPSDQPTIDPNKTDPTIGPQTTPPQVHPQPVPPSQPGQQPQ